MVSNTETAIILQQLSKQKQDNNNKYINNNTETIQNGGNVHKCSYQLLRAEREEITE